MKLISVLALKKEKNGFARVLPLLPGSVVSTLGWVQ